jgi:hypothetical protein
VVFFGKLSESAFDLVVGCALLQSEHFVIVALHVPFFRFVYARCYINAASQRYALSPWAAQFAKDFSLVRRVKKGEPLALLDH